MGIVALLASVSLDFPAASRSVRLVCSVFQFIEEQFRPLQRHRGRFNPSLAFPEHDKAADDARLPAEAACGEG